MRGEGEEQVTRRVDRGGYACREERSGQDGQASERRARHGLHCGREVEEEMYAAIVSTLSCKGGRTGPLEVTRTTCLFDMAGGVGRGRFTVRGRRQKVSRAAQGGSATAPGVSRQAGKQVRGGQAAAGGGQRVRNSRIQS